MPHTQSSSTRKGSAGATRKSRYQVQIFPKVHKSLSSQIDQSGEYRDWTYRVRDSDEIVVVQMSLAERNSREDYGFIVLPDGREAKYSASEQYIYDNGCPPKQAEKLRTRPRWPMRTTLQGVNPDQVEELRDALAKDGISGVDVLPDGSLEVSDKRAWRTYLGWAGLYDRNAGYLDKAPDNL